MDVKKQALDELKSVKTEQQLAAWHDRHMSGEDYLHLSDADTRELESAYRDRARWIWGVDA
ncbi:hypothetical protein [Paradevosia shaoguanensis]|uniref:hypothetical protein n=1 Tax=Paradevosia shaoguanensis TaxID=1335043 RepID=UPI0019332D62|nr:hypothetical protein [Paradevosia shaoguanensis]